MPRCAIDINNGQLGHNPPGTAATRYVNDPPTNINGLHLNDIPNLYAFLRNRKITSKDLPHVDRLLPKQQVNLAIFDCKVRLLDTQNGSILGYITSQMQALEDLVNRLEQGQDLSTEQQVFVTRIASGGGNGVYWAWFMELKCAVAVVELTV